MSSVDPSSPAATVPLGAQLVMVDGHDATQMNKAAVLSTIKAAMAKGAYTIVFGEPDDVI